MNQIQLLALFCLLQVFNCQQNSSKNQTLIVTDDQSITNTVETITKDTILGMLILGGIFGLAVITGRTGHRLIQQQISMQLTKLRQSEEDAQITDEREIAAQIKAHQEKIANKEVSTPSSDTNELHLTKDQRVPVYRRILFNLERWISNKLQRRNATEQEKLDLKQTELYNQFEFEDSI